MIQQIQEVQDGGGCSFGKIILQCILKWMKPSTVVEVGVQYGDTTEHLCAGARPSGRVYGFDLWGQHGLWGQFKQAGSKEEVEARLRESGFDNFELHRVDTRSQEFKDLILNLCPSIDFAFIDGCHSYDGVKNDFEIIYPRLTPLGIIAFHDTRVIDGCREFILDLRTKYFDGTYDIIELPYGTAQRRVGWAFLVKRPQAVHQDIDEICGSPHTKDVIYQLEQQWLSSELRTTGED